jgi:hypothetical protein
MTPAGRTAKARRLLLLVYWGGAAFQAVWIVLLYLQQSPRAVGHHLRFTGFGITMVLVACMVATALWCRGNSRNTVPAATATATVAFITAWFSTFSEHGVRLVVALVAALVFHAPVAVLCAWIAQRVHRLHRGGSPVPDAVSPVLLAGAVLLFLLALVFYHHAAPIRLTFHLKLVWVGLDVFEWAGLVTTGWCLYRARPAVAMAASFTGTLLFCDAWFNVVASTGKAQVAGVAMAFVELPLCALSFWVAWREVLSWPDAAPPAVDNPFPAGAPR